MLSYSDKYYEENKIKQGKWREEFGEGEMGECVRTGYADYNQEGACEEKVEMRGKASSYYG